MSKSLVIVESPAKSKTIEKYLGPDYKVLASYGHVRALASKQGAVDPDHDFLMNYEVIERNKKHLSEIEKALKKADNLLLATDPDREGEAISWHILEYLKGKNALEGKKVSRVIFHEITKSAIIHAVENPRELSMDLVDAQQARSALDYLLGFNLSPLLWKKISPGLSAGRVQSPALCLIAERELAIRAFNPEEYWSITAQLNKEKSEMSGRLTLLNGEKVEQFTINNEKSATEAVEQLLKKYGSKIPVENIEKRQRRRNPAPPFTTSTLQQEASRKLRFNAMRTMRTAQTLYEGVSLGEDSVGLITYMRTDSVTLSEEALNDIRSYILKVEGKEYLPQSPRIYKSKAKNAQEAHEAIRPTSVARTPESVKEYLTSEQFRLYELIWKRTVASQMKQAIMNTTAIDLGDKEESLFRVTGSTIAFPGFMRLYLEDSDDEKAEEDRLLPEVEVGELIDLKAITPTQHFTEPPPRYTEASLVKTLEEYGIGRPSTYASIISTLQQREYVTLDDRRFSPTDIGMIVAKFLSEHFTQYVDYDFTARLEDELDEVARGERQWKPLLHDFWGPFIALCEDKEENVSRAEVAQRRELGPDPKTGRMISVRIGRYGPFAQLGEKEEEEAPKFAALRPNQRIDTITLEEALELFKLPRILGEGEDGYEIRANIGRFGPYIQYGPRKFASLKEDDPYTVTFERAVEVVEAHKKAEAAKFLKTFKISEDEEINIINGRFGPYITDGNKNVKVPKDRDPQSFTLEECQALIAAAPEKRARGGKKKTTTKKSTAKKTPAKKSTTTKKSESKKSATKKVTASSKKSKDSKE